MTQEILIAKLIRNHSLKTPHLIEAFLAVDRKDFVPLAVADQAYDDASLPLMRGSTISQPTTVAFMLELLQPKEGDTILDIGSGSGYTTALLGEIVGKTGKVFGLEIDNDLVEFGRMNLNKYDFTHAEIRKAGRQPGLEEEAPYSRILVSAAGKTVPKELIGQLALNGILVMPVGSSVLKITKTGPNSFGTEEHEGFAFVPLKDG